jgi:hypothetical protein
MKEIVHGIQEQLKERVAKYDDLVNKHVMLKNELVIVKKGFNDRRHADKGLITFLKKKRDHNKIRLETKKKKKKNRLATLNIKEERSLRAQYKAQDNDEKEARREFESNIRKYQNRENALRD